ncbi:MAG: pantoate--beta-alanine ligase [Bacteroidota bacterium]
MEIIATIRDMQSKANQLRRDAKSIGVVPTMGFLHEGHLSLIEVARSISDVVVTTLFVNPTQFGPGEDFEHYPRDQERDESLAEGAGTDILFIPGVNEMYPEGYRTFVVTEKISSVLEGKFRPAHFRGVTTVVAKLFHIVKPHQAVFGQKDAQQVAVIRRMVEDLNMGVQLIVAPILREADGLAMSSRNVYLEPEERKSAAALYRALLYAKDAAGRGERDVTVLRGEMMTILDKEHPAAIDYVAFVHEETFDEVAHLESPETLAVLAVRFGKTRLIDNIIIPVPPGEHNES